MKIVNSLDAFSYKLAQHTSRAGFFGAKCFEPPGEVVGQLHCYLALGHITVIVGDIERQMRQYLTAIHVLDQFHHGVKDGARHRLV